MNIKNFIKDSIIGTMYIFSICMFLATFVIAIYKLAGK